MLQSRKCPHALSFGEGFKVLPHLLEKLGTIDVFLHDSRHIDGNIAKGYTIGL